MFENFFDVAPEFLRTYAVEVSGRWLINDHGKFEEFTLQLIERFWRGRLETAEKNLGSHQMEIQAFGSWFVFEHLEEEVGLKLLERGLMVVPKVDFDHLVIEKLAKTSEKNPEQSMASFTRLIEGDAEGTKIHWWAEHSRKLFVRVLAAKNPKATAIARELINHMLPRGVSDFTDLLQPSTIHVADH